GLTPRRPWSSLGKHQAVLVFFHAPQTPASLSPACAGCRPYRPDRCVGLRLHAARRMAAPADIFAGRDSALVERASAGNGDLRPRSDEWTPGAGLALATSRSGRAGRALSARRPLESERQCLPHAAVDGYGVRGAGD